MTEHKKSRPRCWFGDGTGEDGTNRLYKTGEVHLGISPAEWLPDTRVWDLCRITLSYGGGLGGTKEELLVDPVKEAELGNDDGFLKVVCYDREMKWKKIMLGKHYIVKIEPVRVIEKLFHSDNPNYEIGTFTRFYLCEPGTVLTFVQNERRGGGFV